METKFISDMTKFTRSLNQDQLKCLESLVRKELRRRKKIAIANSQWICNEGLVPCLEASSAKETK
jgi:hypothetical protein